jgi:hypothetical protein
MPCLLEKGSPGAAIKLLPCDHEVMGSWKQPLAEMQGKTAYIRPKVVGPFPRPCASGSYMHRAVLFMLCLLEMIGLVFCGLHIFKNLICTEIILSVTCWSNAAYLLMYRTLTAVNYLVMNVALTSSYSFI